METRNPIEGVRLRPGAVASLCVAETAVWERAVPTGRPFALPRKKERIDGTDRLRGGDGSYENKAARRGTEIICNVT